MFGKTSYLYLTFALSFVHNLHMQCVSLKNLLTKCIIMHTNTMLLRFNVDHYLSFLKIKIELGNKRSELEGALFDQLQVLVQASKVYSEFLLCHYNKIDQNNYPL